MGSDRAPRGPGDSSPKAICDGGNGGAKGGEWQGKVVKLQGKIRKSEVQAGSRGGRFRIKGKCREKGEVTGIEALERKLVSQRGKG